MPDLSPAEPAAQPIATPGQLALASWVRRQMAALCGDAIMAGQTTAAQALVVLKRWDHHAACPAWRGDACTMGCLPAAGGQGAQ